MTHDLIKNIMNVLEARVEKVIITDLIESTYYAELYIHRGGEVQIIDCRPSDAIAVALKNKAKIFVSEQVIEASLIGDFFSNLLDSDEKIDSWFNSLTPDDFGKLEQ